MTLPIGSDRRRDALVVTVVALAARLVVVGLAGETIPPTADGSYYDTVARRIADGHGYTWLWPDGVVTYAAHYPVGYPALVALVYAVFGAKPVMAMVVNAIVGAAAAWGAHELIARATTRRFALAGGLAVALHPALVPYTAALMTEGVTAALLIVAAACASRALAGRRTLAWIAACGVVMGFATLVRPQSLLMAPLLGWLAAGGRAGNRSGGSGSGSGGEVLENDSYVEPSVDGDDLPQNKRFQRETERVQHANHFRRRAYGAILVSVFALAVCAPWTARNCLRMEKCALVSVNGGWNLAIGTQTTSGGWKEMAVPEACKEVFAEAVKDTCFGRAALGVILADPFSWLARAPAKVRMTFDYFGAAPWYLHTASPQRFPYRAKVVLGTIETIASRLLLVAALVTVRKLAGPRRLAREATTAVGLVACFLTAGTIGYLACALAILMLGARALARAPLIVPTTAAVILATALTHAVFFGSGRYGLIVVPFVAALAFVRLRADTVVRR